MTLGGKLAYTGTGCYISNISQSYDCGDKDADAPTVGVQPIKLISYEKNHKQTI